MIAIFGGTFDPFHQGHLSVAQQALEQLALEKLFIMPCNVPVHKQAPGITNQHRIAMLKLALSANPKLMLDTRELTRKTPSYTLLSMQEYRNEYPDSPLFFIIGMDSLNQLHQWHQWEAILKLCHIVVFKRPGDKLSADAQVAKYIRPLTGLAQKNSGTILMMNNKQVDISSSKLREALPLKLTEFINPDVLSYIKQHQLYQ